MITTRELEILKLIAEEKTSEEIAKMLEISLSTVETHRGNMLKKTGAQSVVGLIKLALSKGWIK